MTNPNGKRIPHTTLKNVKDVDTVTCWVKRNTLKPSEFNPPGRIQLKELTDLQASMKAEGFWEFAPILVDRNGIIIDGHRRWTVAGLLRMEDVPVTMVDADADELWSKYNGTRMTLTGRQVMQAVGAGLKTRPAKFAPLIARLEDILGHEGMMAIADKISPFLVNQAVRVARYCLLDDDKVFLGLTIHWLTNHPRMSTMSTRAIRDNVPPNILERKIRQDKPLTPDWS